jgi:uncharacterized sulfatase
MLSFVNVTPTFVALAGGDAPAGLDGSDRREVLFGRSGGGDRFIFASHTGDKEMNVFPQRCVRDRRYKCVLNLHPERTWTTHFTKVPGIANSHKEVWDSWVEKAKADSQAAKLLDVIEHHPAEELYDTRSDPYELTNLAGKPELKPVLDQLRTQLFDWMATQKDPAYNRR